MTAQQVLKVRAQVTHLLDLFISLREKYEMLRPLAFDRDIAAHVGTGAKARGRIILKNTLLEGCVADLVKLALDQDRRTPSARNIMTALESCGVRALLLSDYATIPPMTFVDDEPLPAEIVARIEAEEQNRFIADFCRIWSDLSANWRAFVEDQRLQSFKVWRDKRIAHSELHHREGEYFLVDLSSQGLKWGDLGELIALMQGIVDHMNLLVRGASFAWEMLDEQLLGASKGFWSLLGSPSDHAGRAV